MQKPFKYPVSTQLIQKSTMWKPFKYLVSIPLKKKALAFDLGPTKFSDAFLIPQMKYMKPLFFTITAWWVSWSLWDVLLSWRTLQDEKVLRTELTTFRLKNYY